jgi:tetratricopeptide (TPR) repeat protein
MRLGNWFITCLAAALIGGCATRNPPAPSSPTTPATATSQQTQLTLDQIGPAPKMPAPRPPRGELVRPPLDALELYARAREATLDNQPFAAVNLLEKAIVKDPDSFELYWALGWAQLAVGGGKQAAIAAFMEAAALRPEYLPLQLQLGREYLASGDSDKALLHLRLAMICPEYAKQEDQAALVDLFLARALQEKGYSQAAVDRYSQVLNRLSLGTRAIRSNPELNYLLFRPDLIYFQMGLLYDKLGDAGRAAQAYELALRHDDGSNFDLQARIVRALSAAGKTSQAIARAADLVVRFRANADSLALLRENYHGNGGEGGMVDELYRLHRQNPQDRALLFALADLLNSDGRTAEAQSLLLDQATSRPGDLEVVNRLFRLYNQRNDVSSAAKLLLSAVADQPDNLNDIGPMFFDLTRLSRKGRLRLTDLQRLDVPPAVHSTQLFFISRVADTWNRDALSRSAMEESTKIDPPFAPAYRAIVNQYWTRPDWDESQRVDACEKLAAHADKAGSPELAAEVRALLLLLRGKPDQAADMLARAMRIGRPSLELQLTYAKVLLMQQQGGQAEQLLKKLIADHPRREEAHSLLFGYYVGMQDPALAVKALQNWRSADPSNVQAQLFQAMLLFGTKHPNEAEAILNRLFDEHPDDPEVLSALQELYTRGGRVDQYVDLLEQERARHPDNRNAVERLVEIYAMQERLADAIRALDSMRLAAAGDPDLLYYVANLYGRIGQQKSTEEILQQVLQLDPNHAPANNDLGYYWADQGRNLARAEALIRIAVQAEPDNQSFLDSLGWVLYKRGRFDEARRYFEQAIGAAARPDPVVLDHLGDALYRLNQKPEAVRQWTRSMDRLSDTPDREELKTLRLKLQQKLKQAGNGEVVDVAPVADATQPVH